jgi:transposase
MTDPEGTPLAVEVSAANQHDVNFILPLVFCLFPKIGGKVGRPRETPRIVRADAGYTSQDLLALFHACGVETAIPQRGEERRTGLGKFRWPVERTLAWLKQYRRVGIRRDRTAATFEAFVTLACSMIAYKQLTRKRF